MAKTATFEPFVAVDIGSFSLKFVHVAMDDANKPVLKALANMRIPPFAHQLTGEQRETMSREDVENYCLDQLRKFLTKHLTELLYDNQIQTKRAVTFASGREVTIRCFDIPPQPEPELLIEAVNLEAGKQMPFSMENAVLGFSIVGEIVKDDKTLTQIMVAALQKDIVAKVTENLKGGGLATDGILTLPQTLELSLAGQLASSDPESKNAIIHCGHKTTSIMIYKKNALVFYRDINMGGETITDAIFQGGESEGAQISFKDLDEAIELKHRLGVLPPDEIQGLKGAEKFAAQQIFNTVEKIFQHIQLSISFYISQSGEAAINKIVLSGGSAAMTNFKEFIQESLEVPVMIADPFQNLPVGEVNFPAEKLPGEAPALSTAVGSALYRNQEKFINFIDIMFPGRRSGQTAGLAKVGSKFGSGFGSQLFELDEKKLRILAGLVAALLLLVAAFPIVRIRQKVSQAQAELKKLQKELSSLKSSQSEVTELISAKENLAKQAGFIDVLETMRSSNALLLAELASFTPKTVFLTSAEVLNTPPDDRILRLSGHTDSSDRVFEYIRIIEKSELFASANLEKTAEVIIDDEHFFIDFAVIGRLKKSQPKEKPTQEENEENF